MDLTPRLARTMRSLQSGYICRTCRTKLTPTQTPTRPLQARTFAISTRLSQTPSPSSQQPSPSPTEQDPLRTQPTHFGFQTIDSSLKAEKVAQVFSSVASSYDVMNDLMSLGIHRLWKDHFVRSIDPGERPPPWTAASAAPSSSGESTTHQPWNILDIAGGTGDIAFRMLDHATNIKNDFRTRVTVSDINASMLEEGRRRSLSTPYGGTDRLSFLLANAEDLHTVPSSSIDLYTVAFGIRNFTDKEKALREAFRVLKPGGVFACLEFSKVRNRLFDAVYKRWSFSAIPMIGQLVAKDRDSYQYLVESIERFPSQEEFSSMIEKAGFLVAGGGRGWEDLSGGIAAIHKGVKPLE